MKNVALALVLGLVAVGCGESAAVPDAPASSTLAQQQQRPSEQRPRDQPNQEEKAVPATPAPGAEAVIDRDVEETNTNRDIEKIDKEFNENFEEGDEAEERKGDRDDNDGSGEGNGGNNDEGNEFDQGGDE